MGPRRLSGGGFALTTMTLAFESLPEFASPLRRLDARAKRAAVVAAAFCIALLRTVPAASVAAAGAILLAALGRLPPRWTLARLSPVLVLSASLLLALPFLVDGKGPILRLVPLDASLHGFLLALVLAGDACAVMVLMLTLLATTPFDALLKAAHTLGVPGLVVQLVLFTFRYIFVFSSELRRLRIALRVRGYRNRASRHTYRT